MALSTYTELRAAVRTEIGVSVSGMSDAAIIDAITRAEAKINRRTRLREAETLAYTTYPAGTTAIEDRLVDLPSDLTEVLNLRIKKASESDDNYRQAQFVAPRLISNYYTSANTGPMWYTLRDKIEFSRPVAEAHEVMIHYLKRWNIATDETNWLLTNYPDAYYYGALVECELHVKNDERSLIWRKYFQEVISELNRLDHNSRDDSVLDVSEASKMTGSGTFNILTGA